MKGLVHFKKGFQWVSYEFQMNFLWSFSPFYWLNNWISSMKAHKKGLSCCRCEEGGRLSDRTCLQIRLVRLKFEIRKVFDMENVGPTQSLATLTLASSWIRFRLFVRRPPKRARDTERHLTGIWPDSDHHKYFSLDISRLISLILLKNELQKVIWRIFSFNVPPISLFIEPILIVRFWWAWIDPPSRSTRQ